MLSKYTVLQYLPNPTSGERVNIAIVTYNERGAYVRSLSRWDRVKAFAGSDVGFLKDLLKNLTTRVENARLAVRDQLVSEFEAKLIEDWTGQWSYTLEFTPPRASLLDPASLLNDLCGRFLTEPVTEKKAGRDRGAAARLVAFGLRAALTERVGAEAEDLLRKNYKLPGKHQPHKFDAAIANGVPYAVAMGISFEVPYSERSELFFDSLAWSVSDVAANAQALPVAIVALPPIEGQLAYDLQKASFETKRQLYTSLGATFLTEPDYPDWAKQVVDKLPF